MWQVFTYNAQDWGEDNNATQGGYSDSYVIDHRCGAWPRGFLATNEIFVWLGRMTCIALC